MADGGYGLCIVNVNDPSNPFEVGHYDSWGYAYDVAVSGRYAYVADGGAGLRVVNVSDPSNPYEEGCYEPQGSANGVAVSDYYAYIADYWCGLRVVNVSNPSNPYGVGWFFMASFAVDVAVSGLYAYVVDEDASLRVVDVIDPSNPFQVGYYSLPGPAKGVAVSGEYAYVADGWYGLRVLNVSDPSNPSEVGYYNSPGEAQSVTLSGDYAYVADGWYGLRMVNVSDPSNPFEEGYYNTPGYALGVAVSGTHAYVADHDSGLRIVNVSNPTSPWEVGYYDTPGQTQSVAVYGDYAYVADGYYFGIYDCSAAIGSDIEITLTPINPPINIPASGGSFDFNAILTNNDPSPATFDTWIMVQLPDLSWFGPVLGPVNITLPDMTTIDRDRTQNVPAGAPSGTYTYEGRVGVYPDEIWDSNSFTFEKLETGDGTSVSDWANTGKPLEMWLTETNTETPSVIQLLGAFPNPFNPSIVISYQLPVASLVTLAVYDISGRLVAELINGWRDAGNHEVIFSASNLPSGIYIVRLEAVSFSSTRKIVLVR